MSFFFYYLGYDSHDAPDVAAKKKLAKVRDEEELLRFLLKQKKNQPKLNRKLDKDSIRETLEKHFKGQESEKVLELIAEPEIVTAKDLFNAYLAVTNKKRIKVLIALMMMDEGEEYEH